MVDEILGIHYIFLLGVVENVIFIRLYKLSALF